MRNSDSSGITSQILNWSPLNSAQFWMKSLQLSNSSAGIGTGPSPLGYSVKTSVISSIVVVVIGSVVVLVVLAAVVLVEIR